MNQMFQFTKLNCSHPKWEGTWMQNFDVFLVVFPAFIKFSDLIDQQNVINRT